MAEEEEEAEDEDRSEAVAQQQEVDEEQVEQEAVKQQRGADEEAVEWGEEEEEEAEWEVGVLVMEGEEGRSVDFTRLAPLSPGQAPSRVRRLAGWRWPLPGPESASPQRREAGS